MGHDFNLFHTLKQRMAPAVTRSGSCKDCDSEGDLLCDTKADPNSSTYDVSNYITNCVYSGTKLDECGTVYQMDPHNFTDVWCKILSQSLVTSGQGSRARACISAMEFLPINKHLLHMLLLSYVSISSGKRIDVATSSVVINSPLISHLAHARAILQQVLLQFCPCRSCAFRNWF